MKPMRMARGFGRRKPGEIVNPVPVVSRISDFDFSIESASNLLSITRSGTGVATRVNSSGKIEVVAPHTARIDYDPSSRAIRGLLVEESRTNLLGETEALGSKTRTQLTVTEDQTTAPNNFATAEKWLPTAQAGQHRADHTAITIGTTADYCYSVFGKANGYSWISMRFNDSHERWYDLTNFAVGATQTGTVNSPKVQNHGASWARASGWLTPATGATTMRWNVANGDNGDSYTANGTSSVFIWGTQLENGQWPSSYIPNSGTPAVTVTRPADDISIPISSVSAFSTQAFSVLVEGRTGFISGQQQQTFFELGTAADRVSLIRDTSQNLRWQVVAAGVTAGISYGALSAEQTFKSVIGLKAGSIRGCFSGGAVLSTGSAAMAMPGSLSTASAWLGRNASGANYANGWIKRVKFWNGQLSDAELQLEAGLPPPSGSGELLAFPGAVGFGRDSVGGRGGTVLHVTNLNDTGAGSLRNALLSAGPRTVVFDIAGTITLNSAIFVTQPYLTIAGESAPGNIEVFGNDIQFSQTHNIVVRHFTFSGGGGGSTTDSAGMIGPNVHDVIFDHCTFRWGMDETFQMWGDSGSSMNITLMNCLICECIGTGQVIINRFNRVTFYNNLLAFAAERHPRLVRLAGLEMVNCMSYNSGQFGPCGHMGDSGAASPFPCDLVAINNRYVAGPNSSASMRGIQFLSGAWASGSRVFHTGNVVTTGQSFFVNANTFNPIVSTAPFSSNIPAELICTADTTLTTRLYASVGARPASRDTMAQRTIDKVSGGSGANSSTVAGYGGHTDFTTASSTYTEPASPTGDTDGDGYTNIEEDLAAKAALLV